MRENAGRRRRRGRSGWRCPILSGNRAKAVWATSDNTHYVTFRRAWKVPLAALSAPYDTMRILACLPADLRLHSSGSPRLCNRYG
jgi:hypothetical protein